MMLYPYLNFVLKGHFLNTLFFQLKKSFFFRIKTHNSFSSTMGDFDQQIEDERTKIINDIEKNEDKFVSGGLDLLPYMDKADDLYKKSLRSENITASKVVSDSELVKLQSRIVHQSIKSCKFNTKDFDPRSFAVEVRNKYVNNLSSLNDPCSEPAQKKLVKLWNRLGGHAVKLMNTVPTFSFLNGTFEAEPVEKVKKERKQRIKDKECAVSQPSSINVSQASKDPMLDQAIRVLHMFIKLNQRNQDKGLYFYEFVIDPTSFTRTIENIFCVSLLVKEGRISLTADDNGHPILRAIKESERSSWTNVSQQCVISLTMQDYKDLIEKYGITRAAIK